MRTNALIRKALRFARDAHRGQRRKYTGQPYVNHCIEVAEIVDSAGGTPDMVAAALLHDTVEDTHVRHRDILREFGFRVHRHVFYLSDISRREHGNRAARKKMDREHSANAPAQTKTVKLADLISNSASINTFDPHFSKKYMREKFLMLHPAVLGQGSPLLYARALQIVKDYFKTSGIKIDEQSWSLTRKGKPV